MVIATRAVAASAPASAPAAASAPAPASASAAASAPASAPARVSLTAMLAQARQLLDRARGERLAAAARPIPVMVRWSPRRIATLDVGGALGALLGADLDGNKAPELYAVTDQAVIAYSLADGKVRELSRLPFRGDPAPIRPRDPVATVAVDVGAGELLAGSSSFAHSVRARWQAGALVALEEPAGLPLCAHQRAELAPGRNYFVDAPGEQGRDSKERKIRGHDGKDGSFGMRCRSELTLRDGQAATAVARLSVQGALQISVQPQCEAGCPAHRYELTGVGVAFDLGDVDRDGDLDVAYAGAGAPGDPDAVRVVTAADPRRTLFRRAFTGGVAAVALVDLDGDGAAEVIAAVRLPGSPRVDLWRLN
jgi:hypothetical protein